MVLHWRRCGRVCRRQRDKRLLSFFCGLAANETVCPQTRPARSPQDYLQNPYILCDFFCYTLKILAPICCCICYIPGEFQDGCHDTIATYKGTKCRREYHLLASIRHQSGHNQPFDSCTLLAAQAQPKLCARNDRRRISGLCGDPTIGAVRDMLGSRLRHICHLLHCYDSALWQISLRAMTYLFATITFSLVNAMLMTFGTWEAVAAANLAILATLSVLEYSRVMRSQASFRMSYDNRELLHPGRQADLFSNITKRTGIKPERVSISRMSFRCQIARLRVWYIEEGN